MLNAEKMDFATNAVVYGMNVPNMSAYEIGYDLGYGTEKLAEMTWKNQSLLQVGRKMVDSKVLGNRVIGTR